MAPPREIPGFYFDEAKRKYFKIEARSTAPTSAPWSAENVKKRARRDRDLRRTSKRLLGSSSSPASSATARPPIRRSVLAPARGSLAGDALRLEFEGGSGLEGGTRALGDARGRVWAAGLRDAGAVGIGNAGRPRIESFAVVAGGVERLGYAYAAMRSTSGTKLVGQYIPTDGTGRVCFDVEKTGITGHYINGPPGELDPEANFSSIGYNPHKKILFTSCQPDRLGLGAVSSRQGTFLMLGSADPLLSDLQLSDGIRSGLLYGVTSASGLIRPILETYTTVSAPHNSPLACIVGTDSGAILVRASNDAVHLRPTRPHGPVFALDCSPLDPDLVVSAGRRGIVVTSDTRTPSSAAASSTFRHGTTATHLRVAPDGNQHTVLVAGVSHTMALYDRRWLGRRSSSHAAGAAAAAPPVVTFPDYRNEARVNIGWDVCPETGVVVAAEARGTVGLYSVFSGRRIGEVPLGSRAEEDDPVACLRVATVEGEALPSVFVGTGGGIAKFSCSLFDE